MKPEENRLIWVDGDACPRIIKDVIFGNCHKRQVSCTFVSNQYQRLPPSAWIVQKVVASGVDVADAFIVQEAQVGDLAITGDIPLAYELVRKGVQAVSPRGLEFNANNVADFLSTRDLKDELRSSGIGHSGGQAPIGDREKQKFASVFDRYITSVKNKP